MLTRKTKLIIVAITLVVILASSTISAIYPEYTWLAGIGILIFVAALLAWSAKNIAFKFSLALFVGFLISAIAWVVLTGYYPNHIDRILVGVLVYNILMAGTVVFVFRKEKTPGAG